MIAAEPRQEPRMFPCGSQSTVPPPVANGASAATGSPATTARTAAYEPPTSLSCTSGRTDR